LKKQQKVDPGACKTKQINQQALLACALILAKVCHLMSLHFTWNGASQLLPTSHELYGIDVEDHG
jgi:hypothetical protein